MLLDWLRNALKPSPTETAFRSYINFRGITVSPTACTILCVRFVCFVRPPFAGSATDATLDTGGWLALPRQGLSPCKAHQASLGALTLRLYGQTSALTGRVKLKPPPKPLWRAIMPKLPSAVLVALQTFVSHAFPILPLYHRQFGRFFGLKYV